MYKTLELFCRNFQGLYGCVIIITIVLFLIISLKIYTTCVVIISAEITPSYLPLSNLARNWGVCWASSWSKLQLDRLKSGSWIHDITSAVSTSNVQCVHLAAGRRTQAGDATDQWRDQWNAATVCPTQWRSPASAGWLSWIVDVDRPSVEGHPKQRNRLDSSPGCLGATCQA